MKFRPCIDIHNGSVKQIVGSSLKDTGNSAKDNFVSELDGSFYGKLYKEKGLSGGHVIILNPKTSEYYEKDVQQAKLALAAFEGGLQIGGGINNENAAGFLDMGASHVIVTSFVFSNGEVNFDRLDSMVKAVGKEHLVLDLSCRKKEGKYFIVTDRWQNFTDVELNESTVEKLSSYCDEFLIHAVDVEGKAKGIEENVARLLGEIDTVPSTYAGGISSFEDLETLNALGKGKVDFTIGSALDIFGGHMDFEKVCAFGSRKTPGPGITNRPPAYAYAYEEDT